MGFLEIDFPVGISYGSTAGPGYDTSIVACDNHEERNARRQGALRHYDAQRGIKKKTQLAALLDFYHVVQGSLTGFRWKDWSDFTTATDHVSAYAATNIKIGTGDGVTTVFQLVTKYTNGGTTRTRIIEKPVSGKIAVAVDGITKTLGTDYTVNTTTGQITFMVAPAVAKHVNWGGEFMVPVRFGEGADKLLAMTLSSFSASAVPSIPIDELENETPVDDDRNPGGSSVLGSLGANFAITMLNGSLITVNPSAAINCALPDTTLIPDGIGHFVIVNKSGTYTLTVKTSGGATVCTVAPGLNVSIGLTYVAGVKTWLAI